MAGDWRLLDTLPIHERQRLHRVIAALSTADPAANRKRRKAAKADRVRQEEAVLNETGIRTRRRRPVVTTPNVFPPPVEQGPAVEGAADERRRATEDAAPSVDRVCYVCKQPHTAGSRTSTISSVPPARTLNFAARTELADLRGRVALLTGGRVKIGYQAGLKLLRSGAHADRDDHGFRRMRRRATPQEPDFGDWGDRLEIFGLDLRHTAERGSVLPRHAGHARAARLHHQQRLPDGAPAAGVLRAHDGRRD